MAETITNVGSPVTSFAPYLFQKSEVALAERLCRQRILNEHPERRQLEIELCRLDISHWLKTWCDVYEPRFVTDGLPASLPFVTFPRQVEFLHWLDERVMMQEDGSVEKSREVGATWLICAWGVHGLLFRPGFRLGVTSRNQDAVDKIGDLKSIFERMRFIIRNLPRWMLPTGYDSRRHSAFLKIVNPTTDAAITGEVGDEVGRCDRTLAYIVDEAAYLEHADRVNAALSQTTRCRIDISTANGTHTPYYKKLRSLSPRQQFRFHWAQPLDAKVLTPFGWKLMGDLAVGDLAVGVNGQAIEIIGVYPQGMKDVYRVTFSDGSSTECCADHLWSVIPPGNHRKERKHIRRTLALRDMMNDYTAKDSRGFKVNRYQIPVAESVKFADYPGLPLDPYVLGCLLGDGSFPKRDMRPIVLSTSDEELAALVNARLPVGCRLAKMTGIQYRIAVDKSGRGSKPGSGQHNFVNGVVRDLGLAGTESHTKFVPPNYLLASVNDRLELLRGLMDTDGSRCKSNPGVARFHTTSPQLVKDVVFVAQSLAGAATVRAVAAAIREFPGNRMCSCREGFIVEFRLPDSVVPFKLSRKADAYKPSSKYKPRRSLVNIEYIGEKECQCIKVDADDGLYLTDDCIVTHNTDDPRKNDAWYAAECLRIGDPRLIAQELDIAHGAAAEGLLWPGEYFADHIWFNEWPRDIICKVMALDPSRGKSDKSGDYNVWVTMALDSQWHVWVDADASKNRPTEPLSGHPGMRSMTTDGLALYKAFGPRGVLVEANGGGLEVAKACGRVWAAGGCPNAPIFYIDHVEPKAVRLQTYLSPLLANRRFHVKDTPGGRLLVQQAMEYSPDPKCGGDHDDAPDAAASGVEMMNKLMFSSEDSRVYVLEL